MRSGKALSPRGRAVWQALGIEVEFIHVQHRHFFGHQQLWVNNWQRVSSTDPERTALDLIARSDIFGGMGAAIEILDGALPRINPETLVHYALQYDIGAAIKRLGWTLEELGVPSETLAALKVYPVTTYYDLDPQEPASTRYNARWKIIENLRRENA